MKKNINNEYENYFYPEVVESNPTNNNLDHDLSRHSYAMLKVTADEKDKEIIIQNIKRYYDTLNTFLIKHSIEHPR